jgi:tetratricopeptide (TPR) repeat protein
MELEQKPDSSSDNSETQINVNRNPPEPVAPVATPEPAVTEPEKQPTEPARSAEPAKPAGPSKLDALEERLPKIHLPSGKQARKFWYGAVVVAVIVVGLIVWRVHVAHVNDTWSKATDYYSRANYDKAAKLLKDVSIPSDPKRLNVYAQTMLATRQLDKALPAYNALYETKKDPSVKLIIGNIYNEQKKYDKAAQIYKEAIAANSGYVQAYVNLSTLYKLQNKSSDAIKTAQQGIAANPKNVVLRELLVSMLLDDKTSPDYTKALADLKKINPNDPLLEAIKQ